MGQFIARPVQKQLSLSVQLHGPVTYESFRAQVTHTACPCLHPMPRMAPRESKASSCQQTGHSWLSRSITRLAILPRVLILMRGLPCSFWAPPTL